MEKVELTIREKYLIVNLIKAIAATIRSSDDSRDVVFDIGLNIIEKMLGSNEPEEMFDKILEEYGLEEFYK